MNDPRFPYGYPPYSPYYQSPPASGPVPAADNPPAANTSLIARPGFLKGVLFGAAAAYLLSNDTVQKNAIKAAVKSWSLMQGGVEELKERFRDAEAELHAEQDLE